MKLGDHLTPICCTRTWVIFTLTCDRGPIAGRDRDRERRERGGGNQWATSFHKEDDRAKRMRKTKTKKRRGKLTMWPTPRRARATPSRRGARRDSARQSFAARACCRTRGSRCRARARGAIPRSTATGSRTGCLHDKIRCEEKESKQHVRTLKADESSIFLWQADRAS